MSEHQESSAKPMDKPIKLGEFILSLLLFIGTVTAGWVTLNREQATYGTRIDNLERNYQRTEEKTDRILDKLEVLIREVANKQDRKR